MQNGAVNAPLHGGEPCLRRQAGTGLALALSGSLDGSQGQGGVGEHTTSQADRKPAAALRFGTLRTDAADAHPHGSAAISA